MWGATRQSHQVGLAHLGARQKDAQGPVPVPRKSEKAHGYSGVLMSLLSFQARCLHTLLGRPGSGRFLEHNNPSSPMGDKGPHTAALSTITTPGQTLLQC